MRQIKDPVKRQQLEGRVKEYEKNLLKLTRKTKANHYNNFFQKNKLNLSKTWEGIREFIKITKKKATVKLIAYKLIIEL